MLGLLKRKPPYDTYQPPARTPEQVAEDEARAEKWRLMEEERMQRLAAIPRDLKGWRLAGKNHGDACTCGAVARMLAASGGAFIASMGPKHEDDCEFLRALYVQIIEV